MALAKMSWDELNQLVGRKISEPYDEYFAPMHITEEQKRKRIRLAEDLEDVFIALLAELFYCEQEGIKIPADIYDRALEEYLTVIGSAVVTDDYLIEHAISTIADTIAVLKRHESDPFYYSEDRAMAITEGEVNVIWGFTEYSDAVKSKHHKTWHTIMDGKERDSHAEVNGLTIGINEAFELQGGYVLFPGDDSMGADSSELIGCRCSLSFS